MISQGPRFCVLLLMPDSMSMVASPNLYGFRRLLGRAVGKQPQSFLENCGIAEFVAGTNSRKLMAKQMLSISWIECNLWTNPEKRTTTKQRKNPPKREKVSYPDSHRTIFFVCWLRKKSLSGLSGLSSRCGKKSTNRISRFFVQKMFGETGLRSCSNQLKQQQQQQQRQQQQQLLLLLPRPRVLYLLVLPLRNGDLRCMWRWPCHRHRFHAQLVRMAGNVKGWNGTPLKIKMELMIQWWNLKITSLKRNNIWTKPQILGFKMLNFRGVHHFLSP